MYLCLFPVPAECHLLAAPGDLRGRVGGAAAPGGHSRPLLYPARALLQHEQHPHQPGSLHPPRQLNLHYRHRQGGRSGQSSVTFSMIYHVSVWLGSQWQFSHRICLI